ncbi:MULTISPECIES: M1 family metallopeptidase [unclassified Cellulophaga]|uniref:M1 family metallopeptidase n=1 Tax=unclassified Cellulophaga TaxID=2634405 RepID=UPI0026E18888|nr:MULTISPECIES: M1 family aminopeptidase [unclassified Cellulophaga]MDO6491783.1 M1 family aminopeptidase [Cellulophaga sp. 2_MG-2023]MDO6495562.1 M1 family aminopeptidase [Cellulophaga sp. 3_MG-2023]
MKKYTLLVLLALTLVGCPQKKERPTTLPIEKGISLNLANYRKEQIKDLHYALDFSIPKNLEDPIPTTLTITAYIADLQYDLILDFNEDKDHLKTLSVNGVNTPINHTNEHLVIDSNTLIIGENKIDISFNAGELSLNRNKEFLYTLLVPDRASTLFPCLDQPNLKATYDLTITAPKDWKVLCGGTEKAKIEKEEYTTHTFNTTDKMSTYLFSFVAGKFSEEIKNPGAFDMRFLYRENNKEKIAESTNEIFNIHQQSLDFLIDYTDYKFPFQKMDFASIPPFQYGGMEHVGAIQYRESSLFLDKNATQNQKLSRAKLIAHETSHMWFGDLVTMQWFNDVWMKEVFANFMADKIMNPIFPDIDHQLKFMMTHYPSAYSEDRTKGTNPIRQNLDNLKNAGSLYGRIIYNKAPIMMQQLEAVLGKDAFKEGMQEYIKTYANDNADWNDLVSILDKKSDVDIKQWSNVWVNQPGRPVFTDSITYKDNKITNFTITQKAEDGTDKVWPQSFTIQLVYKDSVKTINTSISGKNLQLNETIGLAKPLQIIYNANGFGYGVFPVDVAKISKIKDIKDATARGYSYINLYEVFLNNKVPALDAFNVFLDGVASEKNELILNYITGRTRDLYWSFLSEKNKEKIQISTEDTLLNLVKSDKPKTFKKTIFNLYTSIATSNKAIDKLYAFWKKEISIPSLFLNEDDYTSLAGELVIKNHPKATEILKEQEKRISNPDKLTRFVWLQPSLSNNSKERDAFMVSLFNAKNREKESWVQSALANIHHPLRQEESKKHLKECLNKLEEVQLTGDIFFPKGWLASSIGKYTSKDAYQILQDFLSKNPNFNPILLKKLLQTTDDLKRAQTIKK